ncbi:hypothetical protein RJT34_31165 [Clitoria ternatea]|uniref:Uncharacterized protein n=1 Tax=Clitoria ternatea TaxID=43366 RepID=A0AAN9I141_CLITE
MECASSLIKRAITSVTPLLLAKPLLFPSPPLLRARQCSNLSSSLASIFTLVVATGRSLGGSHPLAVDVSVNRRAIVIHVRYKLRKGFRKIHLSGNLKRSSVGK